MTLTVVPIWDGWASIVHQLSPPLWMNQGLGLSWTTQKKCHRCRNEVPPDESFSPPLFCVAMHLHGGATGSWQHWWGHLQLGTTLTSPAPFGPWWPLVLMTDWTFLCSSSLTRWGQEKMTIEGNIKPTKAGTQPHGSWVKMDSWVTSAAVDTWASLSVLWIYFAMSANVSFVLE